MFVLYLCSQIFGLFILSECLFRPMIGLSVNSDRFSSANDRGIRRLLRLDLVYSQTVLLTGMDDSVGMKLGNIIVPWCLILSAVIGNCCRVEFLSPGIG